jgi:hypothetical protein
MLRGVVAGLEALVEDAPSSRTDRPRHGFGMGVLLASLVVVEQLPAIAGQLAAPQRSAPVGRSGRGTDMW